MPATVRGCWVQCFRGARGHRTQGRTAPMYARGTPSPCAHEGHCPSRREKHAQEHPHAAQCSGGGPSVAPCPISLRACTEPCAQTCAPQSCARVCCGAMFCGHARVPHRCAPQSCARAHHRACAPSWYRRATCRSHARTCAQSHERGWPCHALGSPVLRGGAGGGTTTTTTMTTTHRAQLAVCLCVRVSLSPGSVSVCLCVCVSVCLSACVTQGSLWL